jgi:hypothetical protein
MRPSGLTSTGPKAWRNRRRNRGSAATAGPAALPRATREQLLDVGLHVVVRDAALDARALHASTGRRRARAPACAPMGRHAPGESGSTHRWRGALRGAADVTQRRGARRGRCGARPARRCGRSACAATADSHDHAAPAETRSPFCIATSARPRRHVHRGLLGLERRERRVDGDGIAGLDEHVDDATSWKSPMSGDDGDRERQRARRPSGCWRRGSLCNGRCLGRCRQAVPGLHPGQRENDAALRDAVALLDGRPCTTPAALDGTSIVAFSVSSVTSGVSTATVSPAFTSTSMTSTSLKLPRSGTRIFDGHGVTPIPFSGFGLERIDAEYFAIALVTASPCGRASCRRRAP